MPRSERGSRNLGRQGGGKSQAEDAETQGSRQDDGETDEWLRDGDIGVFSTGERAGDS
jgi:hypothetical protein